MAQGFIGSSKLCTLYCVGGHQRNIAETPEQLAVTIELYMLFRE